MTRQIEAAGSKAKVAVTRKHFPGTKTISLNAALLGGAIVHRAGLSESILVFDQHRVFCKRKVLNTSTPAQTLFSASVSVPQL